MAVAPALVLGGIAWTLIWFSRQPKDEQTYLVAMGFLILLAIYNAYFNHRRGVSFLKFWTIPGLLREASNDRDLRNRLYVTFASGFLTAQWLVFTVGIDGWPLKKVLGLVFTLLALPVAYLIRTTIDTLRDDGDEDPADRS